VSFDLRWLRGVAWYALIAVKRRYQQNWAVYASIGSGGALVFIVISLRVMSDRQFGTQFLVDDHGQSVSYAATLMAVMGVIVSFVNTQLLMQRIVRNDFVEFGMFINLGIPRAIIIALVALDQLAFAVFGSVIGIVIAGLMLAAVSLQTDFIPPTGHDVVSALLLALVVPCCAVLPVAVVLAFRFMGLRGGVSRVR
jgi:predicted lysophospholipase L1 biosynthesis ABC-type transport system permease subunit